MDRLRRFLNKSFLDDDRPFESRVLTFVTFAGAIASIAALVSRFIAHAPLISFLPLSAMILIIICVFFMSLKKINYTNLLTALIICGISIIFWPALYYTIGGHDSGMSVYFALAIILDFTLLKGKTRLVALIITALVTIVCYLSTIYWGWSAYLGWSVVPVGGFSEYHRFVDDMQSIFIVGILMGFIIMFQTRLYQNEKKKAESASEEILHGEELMALINEAAVTLLTAEADGFEFALSTSMEKIASCMDIDCVYMWSAEVRDNSPIYSLAYKWLSPEIDNKKTFEDITDTNVLPRTTELDKMLINEQGYMAAPVKSFAGQIGEVMEKCGVKTSMAFPIFFQGIYWGFVSYENRHNDRMCSEREAAILQSGSLLLANAVERNESTMQLNSAQLTVSAMFEANPHINILFDSSFSVVDCNPVAIEFLGFTSKEDMLKRFVQAMVSYIPPTQPDGRASVPLAQRLMTAAKEGSEKFETELHLGDGRIRILNVEFKRIPYKGSFAIVGYIFDMTDIHEREMELKRRDQQLSEAVEEAKAANQAKSVFLSTMSHEIRTPMNAILGIAEIQLQSETLDNTVKDALGKIYTSGDMLLGIINDILDLSKIESGKLELMLDKYELASLVSDTAQLNMMRIGSKPIDFELSIDEDCPATLIGDELRVKQILNNILSNAFKYTAAGKVKLSITSIKNFQNNTTLVMSVSDTGQGMTQEQVNRLFDEYSRFNVEANRTTEGTGLGMSITRNLIHLMGGEISVESEPGKGSIFTVHLPQGKVGSEALGTELAESLQHFRTSSRAQMKRVQISREPMPYGSVLIVDDVETNIYVAKGLMTPYELKIDSADSGFAAIDIIKGGGKYDIIFMDHMMPQMDGIEATKIIRDMGYANPIVALTANAVAGQADVFLGSGFDDFISKPIDVRQLNNVLNKLIRDKQTPEVIEAARRQSEDKKEQSEGKTAQPQIDPQFAEIFVRDAKKAIAALDVICDKKGAYNEDEIRAYIINVHGIKSALANVGRPELSTIAAKLEQAGRDKNKAVILAETPDFLAALRATVEDLTPKAKNEGLPVEDDIQLLREMLLSVKAACEAYDKKTARNTVKGLRDKEWSKPTKELLETISECLLHSEFDSVVANVNKFMETN